MCDAKLVQYVIALSLRLSVSLVFYQQLNVKDLDEIPGGSSSALMVPNTRGVGSVYDFQQITRPTRENRHRFYER